jgi:hypothetical protein
MTMNRMQSVRTALAVAGLAATRAAYADGGGISSSGWMSMLGLVGVVGVLFWVFRKTN